MTTSYAIHPRAGAGIAPTLDDVRDGLRATLSPSEADRVWDAVCARVGVPRTASSVTEDELEALLHELSREGSLCQVLAMSWRIRCTAARKLAALGR